MSQFIGRYWKAVAVLMAATAAQAWAAAPRVLFIGNSFTFGHANPVSSFNNQSVTDLNGTKYGGIPGIFKMLTVEGGLDYDVSLETVAGQTLAFHVLKKGSVLAQSGPWDTVIVQAYSSESLDKQHGGNPQNYYVGAEELMKLVRQKSPAASIYGYATWSSPTQLQWQHYPSGVDGLHQMSDDIERAVYKMSFDQKLTGVVRVGSAFEKALDAGVARPNPGGPESAGIDLWFKNEHRHPSPAGCYLSALMFYAKLTQKDPRQLPTGDGSAAARLELSPQVAAALQKVAFEVNALRDLTADQVTTRHPVTAIDFAGDQLASITTAEGAFRDFKPAVAAGSAFQFDEPFLQETRCALILPAAPSGPVSVSLADSTGKPIDGYTLTLQPGNFHPIATAAGRAGVTFSVSDLGVADLSRIATATGLCITGGGTVQAYRFAVPPQGNDSIFVIGNGPPKIPVKKPATQPAAKEPAH